MFFSCFLIPATYTKRGALLLKIISNSGTGCGYNQWILALELGVFYSSEETGYHGLTFDDCCFNRPKMKCLRRCCSLFLVLALSLSSTAVVGFVVGGSSVPRSTVRVSAAGTTVDRLTTLIETELEATELEVTSANDDPNGAHVSIMVVSPKFEGLSRVKRQQAVYRCLKGYMNTGEIHAVDQMTTIAPSEQ